MPVVFLMQDQNHLKQIPHNHHTLTLPKADFSLGTKEKPNTDLKGKCFSPLSKQADVEFLPAKLSLIFLGFFLLFFLTHIHFWVKRS